MSKKIVPSDDIEPHSSPLNVFSLHLPLFLVYGTKMLLKAALCRVGPMRTSTAILPAR